MFKPMILPSIKVIGCAVRNARAADHKPYELAHHKLELDRAVSGVPAAATAEEVHAFLNRFFAVDTCTHSADGTYNVQLYVPPETK